jgi:phosphoribosylglycinamide formyltransferase-1
MAIKHRIVVLASGRGSNFCAIADAIAQGHLLSAEIVGLISNKAKSPALAEAKSREIPTYLVESASYRKDGSFDRTQYEKELLTLLIKLRPDLILLAGYMLVLGKEIIKSFSQKIINIHPSLLPKFRGLHAQKQALDSGEQETGCTVHWVNDDLDGGETILQAKTPIFAGDTEESLSRRLLPIEHKTYIAALKIVLTNR